MSWGLGLCERRTISARPDSGRLILIRQFRIPLEAWVYEFPAGLVDPGETPERAALRELAEETGYAGEIGTVSPAVPTSPGLCTETVYLVTVTAAESPAAHEHEAAESIEVLTLATDRASVSALLARAAEEGSLVDSKLYTYLMHWL